MIAQLCFAGGCFWGTEHFMRQIRGVIQTDVVYANGHTTAPTYEEVCTGKTGHAEAVMVSFDTEILDIELLLTLYFRSIDPTQLNAQGYDQGTQYRTGIYYIDETHREFIEKKIIEVATQYDKPIVVEVLPLHYWYKAEDYHQDYLLKHPQGYCHIRPGLFEMARHANKAESPTQE